MPVGTSDKLAWCDHLDIMPVRKPYGFLRNATQILPEADWLDGVGERISGLSTFGDYVDIRVNDDVHMISAR